jgi:hypothetical protein
VESSVSTRGTERHWIEIFRDRATERLKEILQEDMDWTTSLPILERLNRLHEIQQRRPPGVDFIRQSIRKQESNK